MAQRQNQPKTAQTPTSGNSPNMTNDATQSDYARRQYQKPPDTTGNPMQGAASVPEPPPAQRRNGR